MTKTEENAGDLTRLRLDLAGQSKWNLGYFISGCVLWLAILGVNLAVPVESARFIWIALSFGVLPVAVLASKVINAHPFCNDNPLGRLLGYTHMSVISLSFPLLVVASVYNPHLQMLAMAILYSIDFYVMTWAFGSRLFGIHAAVRTITVMVIWLVYPEQRLVFVPLAVAGLYLGTVFLIPTLRRRWIRENS